MTKLKKTVAFWVLILCINIESFACEVCQKQQPKITMGLTHGAGPQSNWDWVIIAIMTIITLLTLVYSIWYLLVPKENEESHIKNIILKN